MIYKYYDEELEDDDTPYGGTSFAGETVRDFLEDVGMETTTRITTLEELNTVLKINGIKQLERKLDA